jgi:hypothetical protein
MRSRFLGIIGSLTVSAGLGIGLGVGLKVLPVYAQISAPQVSKVVEALRQAAPQTDSKAANSLYSEWQVKADNIPRWSKLCTGRELSPTEFNANPTAARAIVTCIVRDAMRDEYRASGNNELVAVRRVAAWWMTGDATRYNSSELLPYVEKVVSLYQQPASAATPAANPKGALYDRYMQAGYAATQQKDTQTALLYFKRALDERPQDSFATQAIQNLEAALRKNESTAQPSPQKANPQ